MNDYDDAEEDEYALRFYNELIRLAGEKSGQICTDKLPGSHCSPDKHAEGCRFNQPSRLYLNSDSLHPQTGE